MKTVIQVLVGILLSSTQARAERSLTPISGKCVPRNDADVSLTLGKKNQSLSTCVSKCLNDEQCVAMQFIAPKFCDLFYTQVKKVSRILLLQCTLCNY